MAPVSHQPEVRAFGVDFRVGSVGHLPTVLRAGREARAANALWHSWFFLIEDDVRFVAYPKRGWIFVSSWRSLEERIAFRDSPWFQDLGLDQTVSLDLGPGFVKSYYGTAQLNDDGWLARLPAGEMPVGPTLVMNYARMRLRGARQFHRMGTPVARTARLADGAIGVVNGSVLHSPVLRVISFTMWRSREDSARWGRTDPGHQEATSWLLESPDRMPGGCNGWYPILHARGTLAGVDVGAAMADANRAAGVDQVR